MVPACRAKFRWRSSTRPGFGPGRQFDPAKLRPAEALGLGCAVRLGPKVLAQRGFRPSRIQNGWMWPGAMADPGNDFLLRAEVARGGYVNAPEESIYPAAITDNRGEMLDGKRLYRIRFAKDRFALGRRLLVADRL